VLIIVLNVLHEFACAILETSFSINGKNLWHTEVKKLPEVPSKRTKT
jgi:hypothetical protein